MVLLVDGLPGDAEPVGDRLPRPAELAGVVDVQLLELFDEIAKGKLQAFLRAAAGHRFFPALWVAAFTGMRRNELLGLRWDDLDVTKATLSINRGLVAVPYELHETRGKTRNARRRIDLDPRR